MMCRRDGMLKNTNEAGKTYEKHKYSMQAGREAPGLLRR